MSGKQIIPFWLKIYVVVVSLLALAIIVAVWKNGTWMPVFP